MQSVEAGIVLDRIALEDTGAEPGKLAAAIHAQLGRGSGAVPIVQIAKALDIDEIRIEPLRGMEAALVTTDDRDRGAIVVNEGSNSKRRRFSVAHELGHFLNPYHRPTTGQRFECSRTDMAMRRATRTPTMHQRQEIEANTFAVEVLMPRDRFSSHLAAEPDLAAVLLMAKELDVSREAAARRYVNTHPAVLAVVFSHTGVVRYADPSRLFPGLAIRPGDRLPVLPTAGAKKLSQLREADRGDWLHVRAGAGRLWFQVLHQQNDYQSTLLVFDADQHNVDDEDQEVDDVYDRFARFKAR